MHAARLVLRRHAHAADEIGDEGVAAALQLAVVGVAHGFVVDLRAALPQLRFELVDVGQEVFHQLKLSACLELPVQHEEVVDLVIAQRFAARIDAELRQRHRFENMLPV